MGRKLKEHILESSKLGLLLGEDLKILIDDGNSKEDTSSRADGSQKISSNGKGSDAKTSEGGSNWDVAAQFLLKGNLTVSSDDQLLLLELPGNIIDGRSRELNPELRKEGTGGQNEGNVKDGVKGIRESIGQGAGGGEVIGKSSDSELLGRTRVVLPDSKSLDEEVIGETSVKHLRDHENIGGEGGLEDNWHVGGVEKLDRV